MSSQLAYHVAKHLREFHFGKNWPGPDLKSNIDDVTWQEATTQVYGLNTIAMLVYHLNYYITALTKVLQGGPLEASDKVSFDHPPIGSAEDWQELLDRVFREAETFATLIEEMPDEKFWKNIPKEQYGDYYRNIAGITEHCYYHLGQIVLLKKIIRQQRNH